MSTRLPQAAILLALSFSTSARAAPQPQVGSTDSQLLAIGRQLPGFGGLFLDAAGRLNVFLLDPAATRDVATKALGPVRLLRADYPFDALLAWRYALRPLLGVPGVTLLDADEGRNRVVVGVEPGLAAGGRAQLAARMAALGAAHGVPPGAVLVESMPAFAPWPAAARPPVGSPGSVQAKIRPVPGGTQIASASSTCTLGFNAYLGRAFGFVTSAWCSDAPGEVDGTRYSQGRTGDGIIGSELRDPAFGTGDDCPQGHRCRRSAGAFVRYAKKNLGIMARLARPTAAGFRTGSTTLSPASSRFTIAGKGDPPLQGQVAHKVGRTTGWTAGQVVDTCADITAAGSDLTLLCQTVVVAGADDGDGGAPVFTVDEGTTNARLLGLLWGGFDDFELGPRFAFSPLAAVEGELGALRVK